MAKTQIDPEDFLPLTPAVFHVLLAISDGERHGYAIMQEIADHTGGRMKMGPGTLYGTIKRLIEAQLIEESDERPDRTWAARGQGRGATARGDGGNRARQAAGRKTCARCARGRFLMPARADNQALAFSEKVFKRLLAAYPKAHREEYGTAMAQLFRDQCRDAWSESRGRGLARLWLRVLPELLATSFSEHLEEVRKWTFMRNRITMLFRSREFYRIPPVFTTVFLLVMLPVTIRALVRHQSYGCFAWIQVKSGDVQAECEFIRTNAALNRVIAASDWNTKLAGGGKLQISEIVLSPKQKLVLEIFDNDPGAITVGAVSDKPDEAVEIANAVVKAYFSERAKLINVRPGQSSSTGVKLRHLQSSPIPQLHRFNEIAGGVINGGLLGWVASAVVFGISFVVRKFSVPKVMV
jgi:hypothetical protein